MSDYEYLDKYNFIVVDNKILTKEDCPHLGGMLEGGVKNGTPPSKWVHLNTINTVCSLLEFFYNKRIDSGFDGSGYFDFIQDFFEVEIVVTTDHCGFAIIANDAWLEGVIGLEFVGGIPRIWYAGKNLDLEGVTKTATVVQIANFLASVGGMPSSLLPDLNSWMLKFISIYLNRGAGASSTARFLVESALFLTDKTQLHELAIHGALYLDKEFCPIKRDYYIPQFVWDNQTNVVWKRHAESVKDNEARTIFIDKGGKEKIHTLRVCRDRGNTFYSKVY